MYIGVYSFVRDLTRWVFIKRISQIKQSLARLYELRGMTEMTTIISMDVRINVEGKFYWWYFNLVAGGPPRVPETKTKLLKIPIFSEEESFSFEMKA